MPVLYSLFMEEVTFFVKMYCHTYHRKGYDFAEVGSFLFLDKIYNCVHYNIILGTVFLKWQTFFYECSTFC